MQLFIGPKVSKNLHVWLFGVFAGCCLVGDSILDGATFL
jgi:hypothetical protein